METPIARREISPELVLVDPALRERELATPFAPLVAPSAEIVPLGPPRRRAPERRPPSRRLGRTAAMAAALVATTALTYGVLRVTDRSSRPAPTPTVAPAPSRDLVWAAVDSATRYHVLVVSGATVVLDTVTTEQHVRLILAPGSYRWWVWPVGVDGVQAPPIVESDLVVPSRPEA